MKGSAMFRNFDRRPTRAWISAVAIGVALALPLGWILPVRADDTNVGVDNFAFTPDVSTVKPGSTVTFENHNDIPHPVVVDGKAPMIGLTSPSLSLANRLTPAACMRI
jgi:plastocyanin